MTDETNLLPQIHSFCERFQTQAFSSDAERFVVFLLAENEKLRELLDARDRKLIEKMQEIGLLKTRLRS